MSDLIGHIRGLAVVGGGTGGVERPASRFRRRVRSLGVPESLEVSDAEAVGTSGHSPYQGPAARCSLRIEETLQTPVLMLPFISAIEGKSLLLLADHPLSSLPLPPRNSSIDHIR